MTSWHWSCPLATFGTNRVTDVFVRSSSDLVYILLYIICRCVYHIHYNVQQFSEWALKTHNGWCFQIVFLFHPNLVPRPQLAVTSNVVGDGLNITQSSWLVYAVQNDHNLGCLIAHVSSHCGPYKDETPWLSLLFRTAQEWQREKGAGESQAATLGLSKDMAVDIGSFINGY